MKYIAASIAAACILIACVIAEQRAAQLAAAGGSTAFAKTEARDFLLERLEAGPANADDLIAEAEQNGIAKKTLYRAKRDLKVKSRKERGKVDGGWAWELPPNKAKMAAERG